MNFLEICQMVLDEGDQVGSDLTTACLKDITDEQHRKVVLWVQRAYRTIQRKSDFWKFHHVDGVLFETLADGTKDYTVNGIRELFRDSIRARVKGQVSDWRLTYLTYKEWRDILQLSSDDLANGLPIWFVELPNNKYKIEPGPDVIYEIMCDRHIKTVEFISDSDTPLWDEDLHELIVWEALKDYATEYEASTTLDQRVKMRLPQMWLEFNRRYLPEIGITGEFA